MNYRHAFHAGNHLDVFKHAALTLALARLREKPQPFAVLDSHAGVGVYDLRSSQPQRTGEWVDGVGRVFGRDLGAAPAYGQMLKDLNPRELACYPGSPEIIRRLLRPHDRLIACELHPDDARALKARYRGDRRVAVHARDGYEAIGALLPPPERRGLALIDPPFEQADEAERLSAALATGLRRWPTGVFIAWYPIKDSAPGEILAATARLQRFTRALLVEFLPYAAGEATLRGGGLLIANAPWRMDAQLRKVCAQLGALLGAGHARWRLEWVTSP